MRETILHSPYVNSRYVVLGTSSFVSRLSSLLGALVVHRSDAFLDVPLLAAAVLCVLAGLVLVFLLHEPPDPFQMTDATRQAAKGNEKAASVIRGGGIVVGDSGPKEVYRAIGHI